MPIYLQFILGFYVGTCVVIPLVVMAVLDKTKATFFGRKVHDPIAKYLTFVLVIALLIPASIVGVPVHLVLISLGRQGFWNSRTNQWSPMSPDGFRKPQYPQYR